MNEQEIKEQIQKEMIVVKENNENAVFDGTIFLAILFSTMLVLKYFLFPLLFV